MNKFFERSILDELYEAKSDEFAQDIQNEMQEETKSFLVEEQLTNKIKEVIKDEGQQKEMLKKLNEYEMEVAKEHDFWNKMFYKLGVYNCAEMKEILLNKIYSNEDTKSFFDEYTDDFLDYLETNRMKIVRENTEYKQLEEKVSKIKEENPNVRTFLEEREAVPLTDVEQNAVLDILEIQGKMDNIEMKEVFKLGGREMFVFIKQMKLL